MNRKEKAEVAVPRNAEKLTSPNKFDANMHLTKDCHMKHFMRETNQDNTSNVAHAASNMQEENLLGMTDTLMSVMKSQ